MAKEDILEFDGVVTEVLPDGNFRVKLDNEHEVLAYTAGKMRKFRIRTGVGDRVIVEMGPTTWRAAASASATSRTARPSSGRASAGRSSGDKISNGRFGARFAFWGPSTLVGWVSGPSPGRVTHRRRLRPGRGGLRRYAPNPPYEFPSWPGLSRPSTPFFLGAKQGVDTRHKGGHDDGEAATINLS